jgi:teichuronic acid exporter
VLSPSDFVLVGMSVVLYWYLKFVGAFGITATVIRHRELDEETLAELNTTGVLLGVGSFALACLLAWPTAWFFRSARLVPAVMVTCISLIPLGFRSVPEGLMNKNMHLKSLSLFDGLRDIASAFVTVLLAWCGFHYWALILGNVLSDIARCVFILSVQRHRFARPRLSIIRAPLIYGGHVLLSSFAWTTYNTLDNVTAGRALGQSALGFYGMAWTLANTPLEKIVSLVTVLVPAYLSRVQTDLAAMRRYLWSLSEVIALATFPATIGLALVAREVVPLVMGAKWRPMIAPLQVLGVYAAFRSVVAILPKLLNAIGQARFVMRVEVAGLFLMPVAFWIGSHWGIKGIAYGWVLAYPFIALPHYWKTLKTIEMGLGDYIRSLRPALDGSAAMALAVAALQWRLPAGMNPWFRLILEIGGGATAYMATVTLLHRERVTYFLRMAKMLHGPKLQAEAGIS